MTTQTACGDALRGLDELDRRLLTRLQSEVPLCRDPWVRLGQLLGISTQAVQDRITRLRRDGLIRYIGPIYDTAALGYQSVLVAARVPESWIESAAAQINQHAGVSHNYRREGAFNLWFTLAVPPDEALDDHLGHLANAAQLDHYLPLPKRRTFHIGVQLDVAGDSSVPEPRSERTVGPHESFPPVPLRAFDKEIIRVTQEGLGVEARPFDTFCEQLEITSGTLMTRFHRMRRAGVLRRVAGLLAHRQAGFVANGLVVWQLPSEQLATAGEIAAGFRAISHCYERATHSDWPYNLYTMIHAHSKDACESLVQQIADHLRPLGLINHQVLYSTKEYKKSRIRYFVPPPMSDKGALGGGELTESLPSRSYTPI